VHEHERSERRPDKTTYVLTQEGEKEFQLLLRESWWSVQPAADPFIPALSLVPNLPRDELVRALAARISHLEGEVEGLTFKRDAIQLGATGEDGTIPDHVREIMDFLIARARADIDWAKRFQKRVRDGQYRFTGDPGFPDLGPGQGWHP
jgi:hypothetical protein